VIGIPTYNVGHGAQAQQQRCRRIRGIEQVMQYALRLAPQSENREY
jgi:hypothetical protein